MIKVSDIKKYGNLEFLAKKVVEGFITGLHKSPYNGFSVEFAEHKQYNFGDSIKNIDWKVYARTDKLYSKYYEEETNLRCHILIDTSGSMFYPSETKQKISFSVLAAASLCTLLQKQKDAFGIHLFDETIHLSSPVKSTKTHLSNIVNTLNLQLNSTSTVKKTITNISKSLHQIASTIHKRSMVILFSDFFESSENIEAIFSGLQHLKHGNHEVIIFHTLDGKKEIEFEFENRPHEFIDIETNEVIKVNPNQIKDLYQSKLKEHTKTIKLKCAQYKIDFIEVDVNDNVHQVLSTYMVKRQKRF